MDLVHVEKVATVDQWKVRIAASWKAAAASILAVAKELVDAENELKAIDKRLWIELKQQLVDEKIISEAIQKKLMVIGRNYEALAHHADHLPPRYNAIYQLSRLDDGDLSRLIDEGKLSPALEDRDVTALVERKKSGSHQVQPTSVSIPLFRVVQTKKQLSKGTAAKLKSLIQQLQNIDEIELKYTAEAEELVPDASA